MARLFRISATFALVVLAYWMYGRLAVPLIEPPAGSQAGGLVSDEDINRAHEEAENDPRLKALEPLFPPENGEQPWELGRKTMILEGDQVKLLVQEWTPEQNQMKFRPCTIVFTPGDAGADDAERILHAVVLQAPQGAILEFDQAMDTHLGSIGRLKKGHFHGPITLRSKGKAPNGESDLRVNTSDVELTEEGIWTANDVDFRMGSNFGRGGQMRIRFAPGVPGSGDRRLGLNIGGIDTFELLRLDRLHLVMPPRPASASQGPASEASPMAEMSGAPVDITCRGPFRFDMGLQLATFEDHVEVERRNANQPSDQVFCDQLKIKFARRRSAKPSPAGNEKDSHGVPDLQPSEIQALGRPAVVRAPSQDVEAQAEKFVYDIQSQLLQLSDTNQGAVLRQGLNEFHAPQLEYQPTEPGHLGRAKAVGAGWLRAEMKDHPGMPFEARWKDRLQLRRVEGQPVVSLTGGASVKYGLLGELSSPEIHFYLNELPPATKDGQPQIQPDRLLARLAQDSLGGTQPQEKVRLHAVQASGTFDGAVDELRVWFEQQTEPTSGPQPGPSAIPAATQPRPGPMAATERRMEITGRLIQAQVIMAGTQGDLVDLTVKGNVRLAETKTVQPGEKPLLVTGECVHVLDASKPTASVTITGAPAHLEARGIALEGSNINMNGGTNRLWIEGPGRMDMVMEQEMTLTDQPGAPHPSVLRPIATPVPVVVKWQQRMEAKEQTVEFNESVTATSPNQLLRTDTLEIGFQRPLRFSEMGEQPKPERLVCHGGVFLESRSLDPQTQAMTSIDRLEAADLTANHVTGDFLANGPGRATTIRRGTADFPGGDLTDVASGPKPHPSQQSKDALNYLQVRFEQKIAGNLNQQKMTFFERVRAIYGPIGAWDMVLDVERPETWGPQGVVMRCDELSVTQMPTATGKQRNVLMDAEGNVKVVGATFTAMGVHMSFEEAEDLLILEGNGWSKAQLFRQEVATGPISQASAQQIRIWPKRRWFDLNGARTFEHPLPAGGKK